MTKARTLFLTGSTGTLGKELIGELLNTTEDTLYLLIRRQKRYSHWDRARKILADQGLEEMLGTRVHVVEGDVTLPLLGLENEDLEELKKKATHFYHIAALTTLNGSKEDCERVNLGGTIEALKVANLLRSEGHLERFFYFSSKHETPY